MNQFDLNIQNYKYNELLSLFKIESSDNRAEVAHKLSKKMSKVLNSQLDECICDFYKKSNVVISTVHELLMDGKLKYGDVHDFLEKIYAIDKTQTISTMSSIDLLNQIQNNDMESNRQFFHANKIEYLPTDTKSNNNHNTEVHNQKNVIVNTAINEVSPGDLNSIKRITQLLNLNLNSCFRSNYYQSSPTDFLYTLPVEIKNVLSLRLVSIELPNSWYLFSSKKKNNFFFICANCGGKVTDYKIEIPDGNYTNDTLEHYLNQTYFDESCIDYPLKHIHFSINGHNLKSTFKHLCPGECTFTIRFSQNINDNIINMCGWILGYRFAVYNDFNELTSEGLFDAGGDRYVFLSISDFQYNNNTSNIVCFDKNILNEDVIAKIPMVNGKLSLILNDNNNALSKVRRYNGPINLSKIQVKLLDHFGNIIDLNNMDFSMTIELQILYENFNFKNVFA